MEVPRELGIGVDFDGPVVKTDELKRFIQAELMANARLGRLRPAFWNHIFLQGLYPDETYRRVQHIAYNTPGMEFSLSQQREHWSIYHGSAEMDTGCTFRHREKVPD